MKKLKIVMEQTMLVSFLVLCAVSIYGLLVMKKNEWSFDWYTPGSILVSSFLCSLVTVLLIYNDKYDKELSSLMHNLVTLLHFVLMYIIIIVFGHLCNWYTTMHGFALISVIFVVVYAAAWVGTGIMFRHDEKLISDALESVRDKE